MPGKSIQDPRAAVGAMLPLLQAFERDPFAGGKLGDSFLVNKEIHCSPLSINITPQRAGKIVSVAHMTVSANGKTMTIKSENEENGTSNTYHNQAVGTCCSVQPELLFYIPIFLFITYDLESFADGHARISLAPVEQY